MFGVIVSSITQGDRTVLPVTVKKLILKRMYAGQMRRAAIHSHNMLT
jgi:hypothetical protein